MPHSALGFQSFAPSGKRVVDFRSSQAVVAKRKSPHDQPEIPDRYAAEAGDDDPKMNALAYPLAQRKRVALNYGKH